MHDFKLTNVALGSELIHHENPEVDSEAKWKDNLKELITKAVLDGIAIFESQTGKTFSDRH